MQRSFYRISFHDTSLNICLGEVEMLSYLNNCLIIFFALIGYFHIIRIYVKQIQGIYKDSDLSQNSVSLASIIGILVTTYCYYNLIIEFIKRF